MNKLMFMAALSVGLASGCGGEDEAASKSLFSSWVEDGTGFILNLSNFGFDALYSFSFILTAGGTCDCQGYISGTEASGGMAVSACAYNGSGSDPGCASILNGNYTYTKSGAQLTVCKPSISDCGTYR